MVELTGRYVCMNRRIWDMKRRRRIWLDEQEDMVVRTGEYGISTGEYGCMNRRIWLYEQEDMGYEQEDMVV